MTAKSTDGVFGHLGLLEAEARRVRRERGNAEPRSRSRAEELRAKAAKLTAVRDRLKAEIQAHKSLQSVRSPADLRCPEENPEDSQLLQLMAKHSALEDLLRTHRLISGFDAVKTHWGRRVCVSLQTAYEGVYLDTYNLEMRLDPPVVITRHDIPPFVQLDVLAKQNGLRDDPAAFLSALSQQLNAFAGRRRQLELLKEKEKSVDVLESNVFCTTLVLLLAVPESKEKSILCRLDYGDLSSCLPTRVGLRSEDEDGKLPESPEWRRCGVLLREAPLHRAVESLRRSGLVK